ncbi:hypothetical protein BH10ACI4_BH10ACI4_33260 [soil metagenome]
MINIIVSLALFALFKMLILELSGHAQMYRNLLRLMLGLTTSLSLFLSAARYRLHQVMESHDGFPSG